jgi:hypothetical protein
MNSMMWVLLIGCRDPFRGATFRASSPAGNPMQSSFARDERLESCLPTLSRRGYPCDPRTGSVFADVKWPTGDGRLVLTQGCGADLSGSVTAQLGWAPCMDDAFEWRVERGRGVLLVQGEGRPTWLADRGPLEGWTKASEALPWVASTLSADELQLLGQLAATADSYGMGGASALNGPMAFPLSEYTVTAPDGASVTLVLGRDSFAVSGFRLTMARRPSP